MYGDMVERMRVRVRSSVGCVRVSVHLCASVVVRACKVAKGTSAWEDAATWIASGRLWGSRCGHGSAPADCGSCCGTSWACASGQALGGQRGVGGGPASWTGSPLRETNENIHCWMSGYSYCYYCYYCCYSCCFCSCTHPDRSMWWLQYQNIYDMTLLNPTP